MNFLKFYVISGNKYLSIKNQIYSCSWGYPDKCNLETARLIVKNLWPRKSYLQSLVRWQIVNRVPPNGIALSKELLEKWYNLVTSEKIFEGDRLMSNFFKLNYRVRR